jgi:hypothetical protein
LIKRYSPKPALSAKETDRPQIFHQLVSAKRSPPASIWSPEPTFVASPGGGKFGAEDTGGRTRRQITFL